MTGEIEVASPLYLETGNYVLTVIATDDGVPSMSAEAGVYITMIRNLNAPVFTTNYTTNISEYATFGQGVVSVRASDADPPTSPSGHITYKIIAGLQGTEALFTIGSRDDPGLITVNSSLRGVPTDNLYFGVRASDGGRPNKSAIAFVHVRYVCVLFIDIKTHVFYYNL